MMTGSDILSAPIGKTASQLPTATGRVLVVDDDPQMRRLIVSLVRHMGYATIEAGNGREAIRQAQESQPDLILMDCQMPELGGFEACETLRQRRDFDDTPILFLTGLDSAVDKARGFAVGGEDFITKPVEKMELTARIRTHLDLARTRRQFRRQAKLLEGIVESQSGRLDQVRTGQTSMLADPASFPGIHTAVRFQPAAEAGGDFYDIIKLAEDEHAIFVADISGHDLGVAYLTGAMKALTTTFTSDVMSVEETMVMLNSSLYKFLDSGRYVTGCYAKFSRSRMMLDIICAGHPEPLLLTVDGQTRYLSLVGDVLGMFDSIRCEAVSLPVREGDRLFLYTDGLIESYPDSHGVSGSRRLGAQRLEERISESRNDLLSVTVDGVIDDLLVECGGAIEDDVVLLGIEF